MNTAEPSIISSLLHRYRLISDQVTPQEVKLILEEIEKIVKTNIGGEIVEFGCYTGTTSLFIQRLLLHYTQSRQFHVYDSFAGLPPKSAQDQSPVGEQFTTGELLASRKEFVMNFKKAGLPLPIIHKGWFSELTNEDVPSKIALAFLDGDYYDSIHDSLQLIWPHLVTGAVVVVDDYAHEALPGARKAVDNWMHQHKGTLTTVHSLAIIHT